MSDKDKIKRKLITALKLNGYIIRSEFATLIIDSLSDADIKLDNDHFDHYFKIICDYLEKHVVRGKGIEKDSILKAIEACTKIEVDDHDIKFSVIDIFNYPKLIYDSSRKQYFIDSKYKPKMVAPPEKKAELFMNRYRNVLQRSERCFKMKNLSLDEDDHFQFNTVDSLLTTTYKVLERTFILGTLYIGVNGNYFIEDPTGMIELNLKHTKFHIGFFYEYIFVLVNGIYSDKLLKVSTMMMPPAEEFSDSMIMFPNLNYFGGTSETLLRSSVKLNEIMQENEQNMMIFLSDLWLDEDQVFFKLEKLFEGFEEMPPLAIVLMGNFLSKNYGYETMSILTKYFRRLAEIIKKFHSILKSTQFIFVPGPHDPCMPQILPRIPLPTVISKEFQKTVPKSIFTTNPCRIQYCTREIVLYRNDLLAKFTNGSLHQPANNRLDDFIARSIISQGHLAPFSMNAQTVHWDLDHALHLYPLPNLVVVGDKSHPYGAKYKGCNVVNPGCFIESGFAFKTYIPASDTVDDCSL